MTDSTDSGMRERARLRRGLAAIDLHERLGEHRARVLTGPYRRRLARQAERDLTRLRRWERISDRSYATYSEGATAVRINRLLELIPAGGRILDIGIGYGYVTGMILRELEPEHYCGIDLTETYVRAGESMIEANGLEDRDVSLGIGNIFELDQEFGREHDPDHVLVLEVLEHVDDPAGALAAVNRVVKAGTRVLFTVPLEGRLDGVWGHLSVFDRKRLQLICAQAGLRMEHAEPLYNTWSLVIARASGEVPADDGREPGVDANGRPMTFTPIAISRPAMNYFRPGDEDRIEIQNNKAFISATQLEPRDVDLGIRLATPDPRVIRVEVSWEPVDAAARLTFRTVGTSEEQIMKWSAASPSAKAGARMTYVLQVGRRARGMKPQGESLEGTRWLDISIQAKPGTSPTSLKVHRAAYLSRA